MHCVEVLLAVLLFWIPLCTGLGCYQLFYEDLGADHTMCLYSGFGCSVMFSEITDDDKKLIVKIHNELRRKANALPVEWDEELADIAQTWANQCKFDHDQNRKIHRFGKAVEVGQNIGTSGTVQPPLPDYKEFIMQWHAEGKDVTQVREELGAWHYKQLVFPPTDKIGCGLSYYKESGFNTYLFVCNYNPAAGDVTAAAMKTHRHSVAEPSSPNRPEGFESIEAPEKPLKPDEPLVPGSVDISAWQQNSWSPPSSVQLKTNAMNDFYETSLQRQSPRMKTSLNSGFNGRSIFSFNTNEYQ